MGTRVIRLTVLLSLITMLLTALALPASAGLTGAVWTTTVNGGTVDHNVYAAKEAVYLNGGPNLLTGAGWIPPGDYYFQVTNPSGSTLLSTDPIGSRRFNVAPNGIIAYTPEAGNPVHVTGADAQTGSTTVQLMPYLNSPNGEYKMWVTRVVDHNPADSQSRFGFIPCKSKTDNFRVRRTGVTINGSKWEDADGDGVWDSGESGLADWTIILQRKQGKNWTNVAQSITAADGSYAFTGIATSGSYRICEVLQPNWTQTYPTTADGCNYLNVGARQIKLGATVGPFNFGNDPGGPPQQTELRGVKYYDTNLDGAYDAAAEPTLAHSVVPVWIHITPLTPGGSTVTVPTDGFGAWNAIVEAGYYYLVCESSDPDTVVPPVWPWVQTGPAAGTVLDVNAWEGSPVHVQQWIANADPDTPDDPAYSQLDFGNVRLGGGGAYTKGYWHAWNTGNSLIQQSWIDTVNSEDPYNDPSDYSQTLNNQGHLLYAWVEPFDGVGNGGYTYPGATLLDQELAEIADYLTDPIVGEMRLQLAQQLLAMKFNWLSGGVNRWDLLYCSGTGEDMTVGMLIDAADTAWAGTDLTLQTELKDCLDAANNNLNWVLSLP